MNILANRTIRTLFQRMLLYLSAFTLVSLLFLVLRPNHAAVLIWLSALCMGVLVMKACYEYFRQQHSTMEHAADQIRAYMSGDGNARIESNEDGELYRLFHEVNALVAILNAHVDREMQAKKFLKDTISDISHQIKTPLAALNIYNGILQEEGKDLPDVKNFTALSEQELDRIETLIQNLLRIARFDAGAITLEKKWENVSEMMTCVKKRFAFRAAREGKEIETVGGEDVMFLCDRNWMVEAVGNLVKNALDHTEQGGHIRVDWKQSPSILQIAVRDDGSGIHQEDMYHIFKRFYRSRYSKDRQGIGLGLPLAKSITEAHRGTIKVDSEPGEGTVFLLHFPTRL